MPLGRFSARIDTASETRHLWLNNGTYWVHHTLNFDFRTRRVRLSLTQQNRAAGQIPGEAQSGPPASPAGDGTRGHYQLHRPEGGKSCRFEESSNPKLAIQTQRLKPGRDPAR